MNLTFKVFLIKLTDDRRTCLRNAFATIDIGIVIKYDKIDIYAMISEYQRLPIQFLLLDHLN